MAFLEPGKITEFLCSVALGDPDPSPSYLSEGKAICSNLFKSAHEQKEHSRYLFSSPLSLEGEQIR